MPDRKDAMSATIAICDPSPTFRRGLASLLRESGHHPVEIDELDAWTATPANRALVLALDGPSPVDGLAALTRDRPDLIAVAVLPTYDGDAAAAAFRAGATAVIHRNDDAAHLLEVIHHALNGHTLLPVDLAHLLANTPPIDATDQIGLTANELDWIRRLAAGDTVAKIAADTGFSERTMYRRLEQVFRRIGVHNRMDAAAWATRHGYLDIHG